MTVVLSTTKLRIKNQAGLLNQIASVYSSFFRAAMEYIDNAVDAAAIRKRTDPAFVAKIDVFVDLKDRTITFDDNCGGMSAEQLCSLLSSVGESSKKAGPWTNGQFGFGVHAFRGFAKTAVFSSHQNGAQAAQITIDRDATEDDKVNCIAIGGDKCRQGHTVVIIKDFDPHQFRKNQFIGYLTAEIERHFDDVLRSGDVEVRVWTGGDSAITLHGFVFEDLLGESIKGDFDVLESGGIIGKVTADLKLLDKLHEGHNAILSNKGRRVQIMSELSSYKRYVHGVGRSANVWNNQFLVGSIEINDLVSPNLTRDDLKDSPARAALYGTILEIQLLVEEVVRRRQKQRKSEAYDQLASRVSDCLADVLRKYRIRFDEVFDGAASGGSSKYAVGEEVNFGGTEPGGGGIGPDGQAGDGRESTIGTSGPGQAQSGAGSLGAGKAKIDPGEGSAGGGRGFPRIEFHEYPDEPLRLIPFGAVLQVNMSHPDFITRKQGSEMFGSRMAAYVAQIVAGPCVEYSFARRGKAAATPALILSQVTDIAIRLEDALLAAGILDEVLAADAY